MGEGGTRVGVDVGVGVEDTVAQPAASTRLSKKKIPTTQGFISSRPAIRFNNKRLSSEQALLPYILVSNRSSVQSTVVAVKVLRIV